ncbi:unnamed protein product [Prunus armeniaca]|uniref:Uncharacterized protein n=1 Tax=Prunus armeniaca TaxID=36596 RepID=A0A6J5W822_PRUAR|nr:unnamed protein product [Prunus armeniaca]
MSVSLRFSGKQAQVEVQIWEKMGNLIWGFQIWEKKESGSFHLKEGLESLNRVHCT